MAKFTSIKLLEEELNLEALVNELSRLSSRDLRRYFKRKKVLFPREVRYNFLLKIAKRDFQAIPRELLISGNKTFTEFELIEFYHSVENDLLSIEIKKEFLSRLVKTTYKTILTDAHLADLVNIARSISDEKVLVESIYTFLSNLNVLFVDTVEGEIDGLPSEVTAEKMKSNFTLHEVREFARKYKVAVPKFPKEEDLRPVILERVAEDNLVDEETVEYLKTCDSYNLLMFAKKYRIHVPRYLKKDEMVDEIIKEILAKEINNPKIVETFESNLISFKNRSTNEHLSDLADRYENLDDLTEIRNDNLKDMSSLKRITVGGAIGIELRYNEAKRTSRLIERRKHYEVLRKEAAARREKMNNEYIRDSLISQRDELEKRASDLEEMLEEEKSKRQQAIETQPVVQTKEYEIIEEIEDEVEEILVEPKVEEIVETNEEVIREETVVTLKPTSEEVEVSETSEETSETSEVKKVKKPRCRVRRILFAEAFIVLGAMVLTLLITLAVPQFKEFAKTLLAARSLRHVLPVAGVVLSSLFVAALLVALFHPLACKFKKGGKCCIHKENHKVLLVAGLLTVVLSFILARAKLFYFDTLESRTRNLLAKVFGGELNLSFNQDIMLALFFTSVFALLAVLVNTIIRLCIKKCNGCIVKEFIRFNLVSLITFATCGVLTYVSSNNFAINIRRELLSIIDFTRIGGREYVFFGLIIALVAAVVAFGLIWVHHSISCDACGRKDRSNCRVGNTLRFWLVVVVIAIGAALTLYYFLPPFNRFVSLLASRHPTKYIVPIGCLMVASLLFALVIQNLVHPLICKSKKGERCNANSEGYRVLSLTAIIFAALAFISSVTKKYNFHEFFQRSKALLANVFKTEMNLTFRQDLALIAIYAFVVIFLTIIISALIHFICKKSNKSSVKEFIRFNIVLVVVALVTLVIMLCVGNFAENLKAELKTIFDYSRLTKREYLLFILIAATLISAYSLVSVSVLYLVGFKKEEIHHDDQDDEEDALNDKIADLESQLAEDVEKLNALHQEIAEKTNSGVVRSVVTNEKVSERIVNSNPRRTQGIAWIVILTVLVALVALSFTPVVNYYLTKHFIEPLKSFIVSDYSPSIRVLHHLPILGLYALFVVITSLLIRTIVHIVRYSGERRISQVHENYLFVITIVVVALLSAGALIATNGFHFGDIYKLYISRMSELFAGGVVTKARFALFLFSVFSFDLLATIIITFISFKKDQGCKQCFKKEFIRFNTVLIIVSVVIIAFLFVFQNTIAHNMLMYFNSKRDAFAARYLRALYFGGQALAFGTLFVYVATVLLHSNCKKCHR